MQYPNDKMTRFGWNSIEVDPDFLYVQNWDTQKVSTIPIKDHPFTAVAVAVANGKDPKEPSLTAADIEKMKSDMEAIKAGQCQKLAVWINRRGEIVIQDNFHWAAMSVALHVQRIPAVVMCRDEEWLNLKYAALSLCKGDKLELEQPILHPDFDSWEAFRTDTIARAETIAKYLKRAGYGKGSTGFDVGCGIGAITLYLARMGNLMTGYDHDKHLIRVAEAQAAMSVIGGSGKCSFKCVSVNNAEFIPATFSVVLSLLNNHMVDGRDAEGKAIFRKIAKAAKLVFIDAPVKDDLIGGDSKYVDPQEVIRWCCNCGIAGSGIEIDAVGLQRPMIAWHRGMVA